MERLLPVFVLLRNLKFGTVLFYSQTSHHFCFSFNKNDYTTIFPVSQVSILEHPVQIPFRFWSRELQIFSQKSQLHSVIPNICALPGFFQGGGRLQPQGLSDLRQTAFSNWQDFCYNSLSNSHEMCWCAGNPQPGRSQMEYMRFQGGTQDGRLEGALCFQADDR